MSPEKYHYRSFGTTADMGLSISAGRLPELFAGAGMALYSSMCDRRKIRNAGERRIRVTADGLESLMVAWLNELIYIFDTEGFLARRCFVSIEGNRALDAVLQGENFDRRRHELSTIFKAATYHKLSVRKKMGRWHARIVMDV